MAGIADFLDSLVGGFDLICYSLTIGGLFWALAAWLGAKAGAVIKGATSGVASFFKESFFGASYLAKAGAVFLSDS